MTVTHQVAKCSATCIKIGVGWWSDPTPLLVCWHRLLSPTVLCVWWQYLEYHHQTENGYAFLRNTLLQGISNLLLLLVPWEMSGKECAKKTLIYCQQASLPILYPWCILFLFLKSGLFFLLIESVRGLFSHLITHRDSHTHSVGLLSMRDRPFSDSSNW